MNEIGAGPIRITSDATRTLDKATGGKLNGKTVRMSTTPRPNRASPSLFGRIAAKARDWRNARVASRANRHDRKLAESANKFVRQLVNDSFSFSTPALMSNMIKHAAYPDSDLGHDRLKQAIREEIHKLPPESRRALCERDFNESADWISNLHDYQAKKREDLDNVFEQAFLMSGTNDAPPSAGGRRPGGAPQGDASNITIVLSALKEAVDEIRPGVV